MAFGSLLFQGASFLTLLILKPSLHPGEFAFFITQLSWASILGSVATLRLEIMLFQERGYVDKQSLCSILIFSIAILAIIGLGANVVLAAVGSSTSLPMMSILLAFGFGLMEAQSFLCVQMQRLFELVVTRAMQAGALIVTALFAWHGLPYNFVFTFYAVGVALPLLVWCGVAIWRSAGSLTIHVPAPAIWARSIVLTLSTLVNTVYVNAPIVLASATQSPNFVADFGFVMRLLTGPITLIRQAYGHTYLAEAFRIEREGSSFPEPLWRLTKKAMWRSFATYIAILAAGIILLLALYKFFQIENPFMIFILSFATIGQTCVNTVTSIRTPIKKEKEFFLFDTARLVILTASLGLVTSINFDVIFSIVSSSIYVCYILFIRSQIRAYANVSRV